MSEVMFNIIIISHITHKHTHTYDTHTSHIPHNCYQIECSKILDNMTLDDSRILMHVEDEVNLLYY